MKLTEWLPWHFGSRNNPHRQFRTSSNCNLSSIFSSRCLSIGDRAIYGRMWLLRRIVTSCSTRWLLRANGSGLSRTHTYRWLRKETPRANKLQLGLLRDRASRSSSQTKRCPWFGVPSRGSNRSACRLLLLSKTTVPFWKSKRPRSRFQLTRLRFWANSIRASVLIEA